MPVKTPFPWFGGKSRAAGLIWSRIGSDIGNYCEPFFGSGAVWLGRPASYDGWAVGNDLDGNVCNFWRSVERFPAETAEAADYPVNECDLHARHLWLVTNLPKLSGRLMADPEYCEPRTAGWWAWGACQWIGGGWCSGSGPWIAEPDEDGIAVLKIGNAGRGVNRQLPHVGNAGCGVNRQLPHVGNAGRGVNRQRRQWLIAWFDELRDALRNIRMCCGDWQRICSAGTLISNGACGVVLDPPYSQTDAVYAHDSSTVAHDVRQWCIDNGANPLLRIALCGHDGEHDKLSALGWTEAQWGTHGGYQGKDDRERIWFSPHCLKDDQSLFAFGADAEDVITNGEVGK